MLDSEDERFLKIGDRSIPVRCDVGLYGLSAHADKMEIITLAHTFSAKRVFLNHANEDVVCALGAELQQEYDGRVYVPKNGEPFEITIRNKRKQTSGFSSEALEIMTATETPAIETNAAERLWRFVTERYGSVKPFTLEELYFIYFGNEPKGGEAFDRFRAAVNNAAFFEPEKKRPFLFHAVRPEELDVPDGAMEVNAMLKLADE
jgi:hypothetical protein